jgi:hypothetical protein
MTMVDDKPTDGLVILTPEFLRLLVRPELGELPPHIVITPKTELTPIGEQFVIPGCEHKKPPAPSAKVRHPTLWD